MANELSVSMSFTYEKGNVEEISRTVSAKLVTVSGNRIFHHIQAIGFAAEEALNLGELSSPFGWFWAKNLDDTNYVEIRFGTGASLDMVRLNAGEPCFFRLGSDITAPYAIANTASVDLEYVIFPP